MHKDVQDSQDVQHVQAVRWSDASASVAGRVAGAGFRFEMAFRSECSSAFCLSNLFSGFDDQYVGVDIHLIWLWPSHREPGPMWPLSHKPQL